MAQTNNIFTKSYFIKRMIEFGYVVYRLVDSYADDDSRYWTTLIRSRNGEKAIITCIKNGSEFYFRINGPNDATIRLETLSMNVIKETVDNLFKGIDVYSLTLES